MLPTRSHLSGRDEQYYLAIVNNKESSCSYGRDQLEQVMFSGRLQLDSTREEGEAWSMAKDQTAVVCAGECVDEDFGCFRELFNNLRQNYTTRCLRNQTSTQQQTLPRSSSLGTEVNVPRRSEMVTALSPPSRSANQCLAWGDCPPSSAGDPLIPYAAAMFRVRYSHPRAVKPVLGGASR
jgi:hypothetical protein